MEDSTAQQATGNRKLNMVIIMIKMLLNILILLIIALMTGTIVIMIAREIITTVQVIPVTTLMITSISFCGYSVMGLCLVRFGWGFVWYVVLFIKETKMIPWSIPTFGYRFVLPKTRTRTQFNTYALKTAA